MFELPNKFKFFLLALRNCAVCEEVPATNKLAQDIWICKESPIQIDDYWRLKIGEFESQTVSEGNFFIFIYSQEEPITERNQLDVGMERFGLYLFDSLMLFGTPSYTKNLTVAGYFDNQSEMLWKVSKLAPSPAFLKDVPIGIEQLNGIVTITKNLIAIMASGEEDFFRFKRGYDSLMQGIAEKRPDQRLHKFVRAVEAFLYPREGSGTRDFVHRGKMLIGVNEINSEILRELYDLRSAAEHMNKYDNKLAKYSVEEREGIAKLRCYQAERFACELYIRLLTQKNLYEFFEDDQKLEKLWRKQDDEIMKIWGEPISLPDAV